MRRRAVDNEDPDRLYTLTGGRSQANESELDLVTLIVSQADPIPGMQSEYAKILRICRSPTALVELASELGLPVSVVKILLSDLLSGGQVSARHPSSARASAQLPDAAFLKKVLVGLHNL
ncbi:MAG: DUF742 domain-containing protein [Pseudonocardiaceae bacterium]|nr:DUF742 domain-containing protein [Pseudonocardiaceae bacterium]